MPKIYHRAYQTRRQEYDLIRDVLEGELRLKAQGQLYLSRPSGMTQDQYLDYSRRASFFAVCDRTLRGMVGAATRNDPILELPPRIASMRDVATFEGNSLNVLVEYALTEVMSLGRLAMVLDFPTAGTTTLSTPYIATFGAEAILDHKLAIVNGRQTLVMLRLHEMVDEALLDEGIEQHMLLELIDGQYQVTRLHVRERNASTGTIVEEWVADGPHTPIVHGAPLNYLPVVIVSPYNLSPEFEKPPMLDLALVNLAHWRLAADYYHSLYLTSQPTPWVSGPLNPANTPTQIGSGAFWVLPEGSTCGLLEFTGAGIAAQKAAMDDLVSAMASLGARMVFSGKGRNETHDTAALRVRDEHSLLMGSVIMVEAALRKLLGWAAEWTQKGSSRDVKFAMHRDFLAASLDANTLTALLRAWQAGAISHQTLLENLQRGEVVDPNVSLDDERDRIEADPIPPATGLPSNPGLKVVT